MIRLTVRAGVIVASTEPSGTVAPRRGATLAIRNGETEVAAPSVGVCATFTALLLCGGVYVCECEGVHVCECVHV